jgi:hypothetical protein
MAYDISFSGDVCGGAARSGAIGRWNWWKYSWMSVAPIQSPPRKLGVDTAPQQKHGDRHGENHQHDIGRAGGRGLVAVLFVEQSAPPTVWQREKGELCDDVQAKYYGDDGCDGIKGHRYQFSPPMPSHCNR